MPNFVLKNKISERRKLLNLTQSELAIKCYCSKNTISSLERGEFFPTFRLAFYLSEALFCNINDIFYFEE